MTHSKSPKQYRQIFYSYLDGLADCPDRSLIEGEAFTRNRKIGLSRIARFIASLTSGSIRQQNLTYFKTHKIQVTDSAVCQARSKFDHTVLKIACLGFTDELVQESPLFKGKYRLIGVDGSNFPILPNPDEPQNCIPGHGLPHWGLHFNAAFDLNNRYYINYLVQSAEDKNENSAALQFVKEYDQPGTPIWIYDRLFFSFDLATQINAAQQKFVFRMKERSLHSLLDAGQTLDQPLDHESSRILISSQKAATRNRADLYKYVVRNSVELITPQNPTLLFPYRLIIVEIESQNESDGKPVKTMEYLLTNLSQEEFDADQIKELYHLRWNIEVSFRDLKYVLHGKQVHSRKQNQIEQEIDMAVMVYNLISAISKCALPKQPGMKLQYKTNRKALSEIVLRFLTGKALQKEVIWTIENEVVPIRKNRHFRRAKSSSASTSHWK